MRILIIFLFSLFIANANLTKDNNISLEEKNLLSQLNDNPFYTNYQSYLNYQKLEQELKKYKYLARRNRKYREKYNSIKTELELLKENKDIFKTMVKLKELPPPPKISNPFQIINAINYEKEIDTILKSDEETFNSFKKTYELIQKLYLIEKKKKKRDKNIEKMLNDFDVLMNVYKTKFQTIRNKADIYKKQVKNQIQNEIYKLIYLIISIITSIIIFTIIKFIIRKYIKDESIYITNKIINFINLNVIILIIMFFYINNVTYIITILGFASAGIAIAMKDWFMNMFGWVVIMTSGNFKVGDRIKIYLQNGNVKIVGDIIDITLTRIVIYEDVTYTTYLHNRRAGRIVFVPNNVIFNNPIFNYTHHGLSTVWDGIDVVITFDSNYKKAVYLAKEIVNKYSKGYTDITKRRLKKLKSNYNIKVANVEPRIYTFIEENGIKISCWYLNNYATLNLRSTISSEILEAFNKENDIKIAYPTYTIIKKENEKPDETKISL